MNSTITPAEQKSIDDLKKIVSYSLINKQAMLPKELVEQFIDAAAKIAMRQKMILTPMVKNCKQVSHFDSHFYDLILSMGERVIYPSVTTILGIINKEWLIRMMQTFGVEEMQRRLDVALDEGSLTHYVTALSDNGYLILFDHPQWQNHDPELREQTRLLAEAAKTNGIQHFIVTNQDVMEQCNRWEQVLDVLKPETRAIEKIVVSVNHRYAGTLDRIWGVKAGTYPLNGSKPVIIPTDGTAIVDIKTGSEDDNYPKQQAAYAEAYEESTQEKVDYCITAYLDAKTKGEYPSIKLVVASRDEWKEDHNSFMHAHALWWEKNSDKLPQIKTFKSIIYRQAPTIPVGGIVGDVAAQQEFIKHVNSVLDKPLTEQLKESVAKKAQKPVKKGSISSTDASGQVNAPEPPKGTPQKENTSGGLFGEDVKERYNK